ncbi:CRISPR-associated protein Cas6/Cse3/CasE, subtype I-E/ECOLI [Acidipropionibacterium jensenii]|uniref:CRISPR-associated protein Cas6/Cse3/CasE, subtype I-E/ECOLI n=1 Tax=Acidipropionibacterium jensenii TaxID=1749 RepID=A0A448P0D6_9ACTN|nr:type I-E CRISPR-associated protein Cas6/Cse3/CasE [Acidipropionibacterium jensenii]MDN6428220.1 type I-E CRISPR-associated protein Cas6/Cse3/CasE [Propionibacterium sp.]MDN6625167.1 type I-E CRISPR-associated protein Cas6/Cse3/CasE [Acidipropionibacterium jensenii]MDN6657523.1 type I-E CRISPR-associated protein Cas6/Cse3/CasE [Acidipropionibacterium jensenii]VEI03668.1 CRISPR-associated protein Cas6/Cse3/CasE, subtype I-E/ECOLI [Acidipropionibacterium jensenii]
MFLTQFDVNTGRREAQRLLGSPERVHAAVLGCFPPDQSSTDLGRTLWRLDRGTQRHDVRLMIASPLSPDMRALNAQAGWQTGSPARTADYDPFLLGLRSGTVWRFRLTANPTVSRRPAGEPRQRGQRVGHVTATQQLEWLVKRAERCGFALAADSSGKPAVTVTRRDLLKFGRRTDGTGRTVTLSTATFDGTLEIRDADELRHALTHGIGPAKGYGCGLLTLAPPR